MAFIAQRRLRWGDGHLEPGDPVPEEEGRNYASLLALGHIVEVKATQEMSDEELVVHAEELQTKLDQANERIGELEGGNGTEPVEVPDEVTPGITPGWPLDAVSGEPLALSDEQRAELTENGIAPEGTEEEPVLGIVTFQGEFVVVAAPEAEEVDEALAASKEADESGNDTDDAKAAAGAEADADADALPEGVKDAGGGWYVLPDGSKVQGRKAVDEALAE